MTDRNLEDDTGPLWMGKLMRLSTSDPDTKQDRGWNILIFRQRTIQHKYTSLDDDFGYDRFVNLQDDHGAWDITLPRKWELC